MSIFRPPPPTIIAGTGTGGSGGSSISTDDASVVATTNTDTGESNVVISTNNIPAITINETQNILIGAPSTTSTKKLVVSDSTGSCIELINENSNQNATITVSSSGILAIGTSGGAINFTGNQLRLDNGAIYLNGQQVISTADELNYLTISKGSASPSKALVLNSSSNISGINSLSATSLVGTLQTAYQPNINRIDTLNVNNSFLLGGVSVLATAPELNYLHTNPGTAAANKALILDSDSNITGISTLSATLLAGRLTTAAQPTITSLGTITNLKVSGFLGIGTNSPSTDLELFNESNPILKFNNGFNSSNITIDSSGNLKLNSDGNVIIQTNHSIQLNGTGGIIGAQSISAALITGTLETSLQPNITAIGTLTNLIVSDAIGIGTSSPNQKMEILDSDGSCLRLSKSDSLYADLQINASGDLQIIPVGDLRLSIGKSLKMNAGDISGVSSLTATSITGAIQTASQTKITEIGTLTNLTVSNAIGCETIIATSITGAIQTASQTKITAIGTLTNLTVSNAIGCETIIATSITGDIQTASQTKITEIGTLTNLTVSNTLTTANVSATNLFGAIQTASQTKITAIGTLDSLNVTNTINCESLTATSITGDIQTASQTKITAIGTLDSLNVTNTINCESLTATSITGSIQTAFQSNIRTVGVLTNIYTSGRIGINTITPIYDIDIVSNDGTGIQINYNESNISIGASSTGDCVITTNANRLILANSTDLHFTGSGGITGLSSFSAESITGLIETASQPNITSLGSLNNLKTKAIQIGDSHSSTYDISVSTTTGKLLSLTDGTILITNRIIDGEYIINSSNSRVSLAENVNLVLNGGTIIGLNSLSIAGNTIDANQLALLANISVGTVAADSLIAADANLNLTGFNQLTANQLYGELQTGAQPNITSLGTLGSLTITNELIADTLTGELQTAARPNITSLGSLDNLLVSGNVGIGATSPVKKLEINSTTGDCLRLSYDKATTNTNNVNFSVSSGGNLTIEPSGGITTINRITSTSIVLGNTSNSTMPLEVGHVPFVMTAAYAYNTNMNSKGTIAAGGTTSYNYSIRALGRILCTQSLDVTSDRRVKYNVNELSDEYCTRFVKETSPVSFNWKTGDNCPSYGYIAQDLLRHGFDDLVNLAQDNDMIEEIDDDGLISPNGIKFTISYQHIIPILAKNQKRLMKENKELKQTIDKLMEIVLNR